MGTNVDQKHVNLRERLWISRRRLKARINGIELPLVVRFVLPIAAEQLEQVPVEHHEGLCKALKHSAVRGFRIFAKDLRLGEMTIHDTDVIEVAAVGEEWHQVPLSYIYEWTMQFLDNASFVL